jgi:hypothetical protein
VTKPDFIKRVQDYVAETSVGTSALRNQGAKGMIGIAREYLKKITLKDFDTADEVKFRAPLDKHTERLRKRFPDPAQHWGAARKALNRFLMDACHNRHLFRHYGLGVIEHWLEVPLDSHVAKHVAKTISGKRGAIRLPRWTSIKSLKPCDSDTYQNVAKAAAARRGIARVHLDLSWWRND